MGSRWRERRGRRLSWLGAALIILASATVVAACSSGSNTPGVASLGGHGQGTATTPTLSSQQLATQGDTDFINFARCLRSHGVAEPDPFHRPGHAGLTIDVPTPNPHNRAALAACNHFIAKIVATKEAGASQQLASWLPALTRYAVCMRSHDIAMLDPDQQGQVNLGRVPGITSDFGRYSPQFRWPTPPVATFFPLRCTTTGRGHDPTPHGDTRRTYSGCARRVGGHSGRPGEPRPRRHKAPSGIDGPRGPDRSGDDGPHGRNAGVRTNKPCG